MNEGLLAAQLSARSYVYDVKLLDLVNRYESLENLYDLFIQDSQSLPLELLKKLENAWDRDSLLRMEELLKKLSIQCLILGEANYPVLLSQIADPPYVLFCKGHAEVLNKLSVSMVGTRKISTYGKRVVDSLVAGLQGSEIVVISGLALGIDAAVHQAALANNMETVAVLAGGLDRYEPTTNSNLGVLIESSGCLVSEYPPGVRPEKHHFLARNRIISGLAGLTIVIEGEQKSGSLVTARSALSYGREVGAVPGDIFIPTSLGPLSLIKDGAWPITQSADILNILGVSVVNNRQSSLIPEPFASALTSPLSFDELVSLSGRSLRDVQGLVTEWELSGLITQNSAGEYYRK